MRGQIRKETHSGDYSAGPQCCKEENPLRECQIVPVVSKTNWHICQHHDTSFLQPNDEPRSFFPVVEQSSPNIVQPFASLGGCPFELSRDAMDEQGIGGSWEVTFRGRRSS